MIANIEATPISETFRTFDYNGSTYASCSFVTPDGSVFSGSVPVDFLDSYSLGRSFYSFYIRASVNKFGSGFIKFKLVV